MMTNQVRIALYGITLTFFALIGLEWAVYNDPLEFYPFIINQLFNVGPFIRLLFIVLLMACFVLQESSLQADLENKKKRDRFTLTDKQYYTVACVFLVGTLLFLKAEKLMNTHIFMLVGFVLIAPTAPLVTQKFKKLPPRYKVKTDTVKIENEDSFNLEGDEGTVINIPNPFRGILVVGSNGSGKSASVAEPIIAQGAYKNYTGAIFDFKFPTLTNYAYRHYSREGCKVKLCVVNFVDLHRTHRFNPLKPEHLLFSAYGYEFATALYCTLNPHAIRKKDFWDTSAISILAGVIWYLKIHYPTYCTVPHVLNLILGHDVYSLIGLLETNYETKTLVASVSTAIKTKAEPQLAGQYGSLQNAIGRINTKEINWVLSGDDFDLSLNDKKNPKLLCIGTAPSIVDALSPIVSLILTAAIKQLNQQDKEHSMVLLDEGPQCYIPNLSQLPATGRSNKVATIYMAQDNIQIVNAYGKEEAGAIISNLNTQLFGKNPNIETGEYVSKLFGKEEMLQRNENQNRSQANTFDAKGGSASQGVSFSLQEKSLVKPHELNRLEAGEFMGILAETKEPSFHTRVKLKKFTFPEGAPTELPVFGTNIDAEGNFERIRLECEGIIDGSIKPVKAELLIR